jgi:hypothetical protein
VDAQHGPNATGLSILEVVEISVPLAEYVSDSNRVTAPDQAPARS